MFQIGVIIKRCVWAFPRASKGQKHPQGRDQNIYFIKNIYIVTSSALFKIVPRINASS